MGTIDGEGEWGFLSLGPYAALFRASIAKKIAFDTDIDLMEDTIWNARFLREGDSFVILQETLYLYRMNEYSATHNYSVEIVPKRMRALERLSLEVSPDAQRWFALRALANFYCCCKGIMWSQGGLSTKQRIAQARKMSRHPVWGIYGQAGIAHGWPIRQIVKRWAALTGIVPFLMIRKG